MTDSPSDHRPTPYDLVFGGTLEADAFPGIRDEAAEREVDPSDMGRFGFLSLAGDAVRTLGDPDAPPEALEQYRALVYHAYNFWRRGKQVYDLDAPLVRYLVEGSPSLDGWELEMPQSSIYLRLPRHLFWGSLEEGGTPEPIDGVFITRSRGSGGAPHGGRLEVLMVLGIRRDRAGFGVIPISAEVHPGAAAEWVRSPGRDTGRDFENILPGGEMKGLYSIITSSEVLKLVARAMWYVDAYPGDVVDADAGADGEAPGEPGRIHTVRLGQGAS